MRKERIKHPRIPRPVQQKTPEADQPASEAYPVKSPPSFQLKAAPQAAPKVQAPTKQQPSNQSPTDAPAQNAPETLLGGFSGEANGAGKEHDMEFPPHSTRKIVAHVIDAAKKQKLNMQGMVVQPGIPDGKSVRDALKFIEKKAGETTKIIVYGYSKGGDDAVELALQLAERDIPIELLFTVDAPDGPFMGTTVKETIPDNVKLHINEFQSTHARIGVRSDKHDPRLADAQEVFNHNLGSHVKGIEHSVVEEGPQPLIQEIIKHYAGLQTNPADYRFANPSKSGNARRKETPSMKETESSESEGGEAQQPGNEKGGMKKGGKEA
ncbi:MAG: hypothetical protein AAF570_01705 [Bacteroidota bacterium]